MRWRRLSCTLLSSADRLPEMGRQARALAEARADWKKNFPKLFKAYEIALSISA